MLVTVNLRVIAIRTSRWNDLGLVEHMQQVQDAAAQACQTQDEFGAGILYQRCGKDDGHEIPEGDLEEGGYAASKPETFPMKDRLIGHAQRWSLPTAQLWPCKQGRPTPLQRSRCNELHASIPNHRPCLHGKCIERDR